MIESDGNTNKSITTLTITVFCIFVAVWLMSWSLRDVKKNLQIITDRIEMIIPAPDTTDQNTYFDGDK